VKSKGLLVILNKRADRTLSHSTLNLWKALFVPIMCGVILWRPLHYTYSPGVNLTCTFIIFSTIQTTR